MFQEKKTSVNTNASGLGGACDKASPSFSPELSKISVCGPPGTERTRRDGLKAGAAVLNC